MTHFVVFCLSTETYDDIVRREFCRPPDQGLLALAGAPEVTSLVVVDPWRSVVSEVFRRRRLQTRMTAAVGDRNVTRYRPLRLRRRDPTTLAGVARTYRRLDRRLHRLARQKGADSVSVVAYHPLVAAHCGHAWADRRVFVARDDWASAPRKRPYWPAYREAYARIAAACTAVFAVSEELAQRVAPNKAVALPNGVDGQLWRPIARPRGVAELGTYAVYSGSIEVRLDLELVDAILGVIPTLVLAGPVLDAALRHELDSRPGIHLTGSIDQRTLVDVVMGAAVGVIPHHVTPMTAAMSPLKMYEYLAAGLPVVATDLPGVREGRELSDRVWLCESPLQWTEAMTAALAAGRTSVAERRRMLDTVSWSARLRPLVEAAGPPG